MVHDLLVEVAVIGELHHDAESIDSYHKFLPSKNTYL